jgi:hypothetical protein
MSKTKKVNIILPRTVYNYLNDNLRTRSRMGFVNKREFIERNIPKYLSDYYLPDCFLDLNFEQNVHLSFTFHCDLDLYKMITNKGIQQLRNTRSEFTRFAFFLYKELHYLKNKCYPVAYH